MDLWVIIFIGLTFSWTFNQQIEINSLKNELQNLKHKIDNINI